MKNDNPKIFFILAGDKNKASSRVRGYWIAEEMEKLGLSCTLRNGRSKLSLIYYALLIPRFDAIIFQKTYSRYHVLLMRYAKFLGKSTYLDIDDAPSAPGSPVTIRNFEAMARMASSVFAGSTTLYDYIERIGGTVHLIPTGIRLENYHRTTHSGDIDTICVGWIGNGNYYCEDLLEILCPPLTILAKQHRLRLKIVGAMGNSSLHRGFSGIDSLEVKFVNDIDWADPTAAAAQLEEVDIGVYPLLENATNQFKCGYKALEYMACSIPVVASPNQANRGIISDGVDGYLAGTSSEWYSMLQALITDTGLRRRMGAMGRTKAEEKYSVKSVAEKVRGVLGMRLASDGKPCE